MSSFGAFFSTWHSCEVCSHCVAGFSCGHRMVAVCGSHCVWVVIGRDR